MAEYRYQQSLICVSTVQWMSFVMTAFPLSRPDQNAISKMFFSAVRTNEIPNFKHSANGKARTKKSRLRLESLFQDHIYPLFRFKDNRLVASTATPLGLQAKSKVKAMGFVSHRFISLSRATLKVLERGTYCQAQGLMFKHARSDYTGLNRTKDSMVGCELGRSREAVSRANKWAKGRRLLRDIPIYPYSARMVNQFKHGAMRQVTRSVESWGSGGKEFAPYLTKKYQPLTKGGEETLMSQLRSKGFGLRLQSYGYPRFISFGIKGLVSSGKDCKKSFKKLKNITVIHNSLLTEPEPTPTTPIGVIGYGSKPQVSPETTWGGPFVATNGGLQPIMDGSGRGEWGSLGEELGRLREDLGIGIGNTGNKGSSENYGEKGLSLKEKTSFISNNDGWSREDASLLQQAQTKLTAHRKLYGYAS